MTREIFYLFLQNSLHPKMKKTNAEKWIVMKKNGSNFLCPMTYKKSHCYVYLSMNAKARFLMIWTLWAFTFEHRFKLKWMACRFVQQKFGLSEWIKLGNVDRTFSGPHFHSRSEHVRETFKLFFWKKLPRKHQKRKSKELKMPVKLITISL